MLLVRSDVNVNQQGKDGVTALGLASLRGDEQIVTMILGRKDIDINVRNDDGMSPFAISMIKNHLHISRILLNRSDLVIGRDENKFIDPFHVAASKELIAFGCDVDACHGSKSLTIIPIALLKCQDAEKLENIIEQLLEAGARVSIEHVTIAIMGRVPHLYSKMFEELITPSPLKRLCRKSIWKSIRESNGGTNVQDGIQTLKQDLPATLINYLAFKS